MVSVTSLCHCSVSPKKSIPAEVISQHMDTQNIGNCIMVARRFKREEHFDARFNRWASQSKGEASLKQALIDKGITTRVELANAGAFRTQEDEDLKYLAARMGCDSIFSYRETLNPNTTFNMLSIFYITLVGMFIFPGNNLQMEVTWDVKLFPIKGGESLFEGAWHGTSNLYHFRPGSFYFVFAQAYTKTVDAVVQQGIINLDSLKPKG